MTLVLPPSATVEYERALDGFMVNARRIATQVCRNIHDATHETEYDHDRLLALLAQECAFAGSKKAWALMHEVSLAYVTDVLKERREPGEKILKALGFEPVKRYRRTA